jgi:hypothetical protein
MGYEEEEVADLKDLDFTQPQVFGVNNELDILTFVHHRFDFDICFQRARSCKNGQGNTIYFLHLNDLRNLKVTTQRPQDMRDVIMIDDFMSSDNKPNH